MPTHFASSSLRSVIFLLVFLFGIFDAQISAQTPPKPIAPFTVAPTKATGSYQSNEKIVWEVKVKKEALDTVKTASYIIRKSAATPVGQGTLNFVNGEATIETTSNVPGTLLVEVTTTLDGKETPKALGGAVIDYDKIGVSAPAPDDFDEFWKSKIADLMAVPMNPVVSKIEDSTPGVDYYKVTLDNIKGTHVYGQLARPSSGDKFPAILIVQWAGVYPLQKNWVLNYASQGWLALNIMAHDLPFDEPKEFYDNLTNTTLKGYTTFGDDNRETSYFLRMFLGCYRAADYLAQRPDWNGQVMVVTGTSQGGMQSFVTAALYPKITAMMVLVPAGCDTTALRAGRQPGWPNWKNDPKVQEVARYYDPVNFAARIKCPALVAPGLIDTTARPEGIFAAYNQLQGPKEAVILTLSDHHGSNNAQKPYVDRAAVWREAMKKGQTLPPSP